MQRLAARLLASWRAGLVLPPSSLRELRRILERPVPCSRLQSDGSCLWLRKYANVEGLPLPEAGKRAFCHRQLNGTEAQRYDQCNGFSKRLASKE